MTERILIIGPAWIGDMVMANALFRYLKHCSPQREIHVLAPAWSLPLLERMPPVDRAIPIKLGHGELKLWYRYQLARDLRQYAYQQAIVLPRSYKSALIPFWAKIPRRSAWSGQGRWRLINDARPLDKKALPLMVQRYLALADASPDVLASIDLWHPQLRGNASKTDEIRTRFGLDADRPLLALCPGAAYGPAKRWPTQHFATLANELLAQNWQIALLGSTEDKLLANEIQQATASRCIDLIGNTKLGEAIDCLALTDCVVTNDSGSMHVAAALGRPLIAVYGSSSPGYTPPLSNQAHILSLNLACSPCFKRECPFGHLNCLQQLMPDQVLGIIHRLF